MSATLVTAAAAGWYHDPYDSGAWRWWDGATWTAHVRPIEETASIPVVQPISQPVAVQPESQPISQPVAVQPESQPISEPVSVVSRPIEMPVPAPQPVDSQPVDSQPVDSRPVNSQPVIPQPAQPIEPIQPVSMTPETPPSEQEYWHSPNAEIITIPGRSATSQHSNGVGIGPGGRTASSHALDHEWGDVGSPNTPGIWQLAFLPIISFGLLRLAGIVFQTLTGSTGAALNPIAAAQTALAVLIGYVLVVVASAWIFAARDIATLRARGYRPPSIWWMLVPLSPLAYFIARGKVVRAEGKRAWPPELLFFLSIVIPIALVVLLTIFAMSIVNDLIPSGLPV